MKICFFLNQQVKSKQLTWKRFATFHFLLECPSTYKYIFVCYWQSLFPKWSNLFNPSLENTPTLSEVLNKNLSWCFHRPIGFRHTWMSSPPCRAQFGQLGLCSGDFPKFFPELHSCSLSPDSSRHASSSLQNLEKHGFHAFLVSPNSQSEMWLCWQT